MQHPIDHMMFHNKTTIPSTGLEYLVGSGITSINIEFETTGAFVATFEAKGNPNVSTWKSIMSCNLGTLELANTVNDKSYIYQIDVTGISFLRINLKSVSSPIDVFGECVS